MQRRPQSQIVPQPISSLQVNPDHARVHPKSQVAALSRAIAAFNFVVPVLVDKDLVIQCGHARVEACKALGWAEIPTIMIEHLDKSQARAFVIAENRIAEMARWDDRKLALSLKVLAELDLSFSIEATGFTIGEIDLRIESLQDPGAYDDPDDDPPAAGPPVCQVGDVWILGRHRVICGSALDGKAYRQLLSEGEIAAASFCDPPYNVPISGHVSGKGQRKHREFVMAAGEMAGPEFTTFLAQACRLVAQHSADGSVHFWCMDWKHVQHLLAAGLSAFDDLLNICVWTKNNGGMGSLYRSAHELIGVFRLGRNRHRNNVQLGRYGRNRTNVWSYPGANTFLRSCEDRDLLAQHPTPKPVTLIADAILDVTTRRDIVLDVFLGSGSSLMACERVGRRCRGIELDPLYVDLTIRRWQRVSGEAAIQERSGRDFNDLAAATGAGR